jgi:dihydrolipoamide dehydrogenase
MADTSFDVIIIGSGPGGYVTAIRAAQLGFKTAIIEKSYLGGICLNWGCIPTKALLRSAEIYHYMQHAKDYGLSAENVSFDPKAVVARSRGVSKRLNDGVGFLMKKNKVTVIWGDASIDAPGKVTVKKSAVEAPKGALGEGAYQAKHIILATGARPRVLPGLEPDKKLVWTYFEAMVPERMPKSLLVIGSGAIGIEFASFYNELGAKVTVVEMLDRIVPVEDAEVSRALTKSVTAQGMEVLTSAGVEALKPNAAGVAAKIKLKDGKVEERRFSHAIVAVGIAPNTENIGIDKLGVKTTKGHIDTDPMCRTSVPGLWAIGDVTAPPWLAHKASHEGIIAAEAVAQALGNKDVHPHAMDVLNIPGCTYCRPQVASVGLTEAKAKEGGHEVKVGRFPFPGNGRPSPWARPRVS